MRRAARIIPSMLLVVWLSQALAWAKPPGLARTDAALDYMQSAQWDYASYEWRRLLDEDPNNVKAHLGLAESLAAAGFPQDAIWHLETERRRLSDPRLEAALGGCMKERVSTSGLWRYIWN